MLLVIFGRFLDLQTHTKVLVLLWFRDIRTLAEKHRKKGQNGATFGAKIAENRCRSAPEPLRGRFRKLRPWRRFARRRRNAPGGQNKKKGEKRGASPPPTVGCDGLRKAAGEVRRVPLRVRQDSAHQRFISTRQYPVGTANLNCCANRRTPGEARRGSTEVAGASRHHPGGARREFRKFRPEGPKRDPKSVPGPPPERPKGTQNDEKTSKTSVRKKCRKNAQKSWSEYFAFSTGAPNRDRFLDFRGGHLRSGGPTKADSAKKPSKKSVFLFFFGDLFFSSFFG